MIKQIDSWEFLFDFYKYDKSIADLFNSALGVKSLVKIRTDNSEVLLEEILSLLPNNIEQKTYKDFLCYVTPKYCQEGLDEIEDLENVFLNHVWINILGNSSANSCFSKEIRQNSIPNEYIPYLILYSVDTTKEWFLYGGISAFCFVDEEKELKVLLGKLKKGYKSWQNFFHFYSNPTNIKSKLFRSKKLSPEQLFPLMTLLIVLKREWEYSKKNEYINLKYNSLKKTFSTNNICMSLIYGLYNKFEDADAAIIQKFDKDIPIIEIHPLVAKHIIDFKSFMLLFDTDNLLSTDEITAYRKNKYINTEKKLGDRFIGKRLLIDFLFPQTIVRENDVYIPSDSITDWIYLSLFKGNLYREYWRNPDDEELFDAIQIEPNTNLSGEYEDNRVIDYRDNLKPSGSFLIVTSNESDIINNRIKDAFSDFRHDLKDLMSAVNIKHLQEKIKYIIRYSQIIQKVLSRIEAFLNNPTDKSLCNEAREIIKVLDNDQELKKTIQDDTYDNSVYEIRQAIEDYNLTSSFESLQTIPVNLKRLENIIINKFSGDLSKCQELVDSVDESHNTLCSYIKIAGSPTIEKKDNLIICDYLSKYIRNVTLNAKRVQISLDCANVDSRCSILYNSAVLNVILNSIVDNALSHGFEKYDCDHPMIKFYLQENDEFVLLKICNNGRPIDITNEDYKTRGVFSGTTGHTGLGGYQISKFAEILGGYVELPKEKEWNTEIHLYIKK